MKLEMGMLRGCSARGPRDSNAVPGEGWPKPSGPVAAGAAALLPKPSSHGYCWPLGEAGQQSPDTPPASFSVTGRGWFVCGRFASSLAPLTRLAVPLTLRLSSPCQHCATVLAQRRAVPGPRVSPGGGQHLGRQDAQRVERGTSPAPGDIPDGASPGPQPVGTC